MELNKDKLQEYTYKQLVYAFAILHKQKTTIYNDEKLLIEEYERRLREE